MGLDTIALVWPGATPRVFGILFGVTGADSILLGLICFPGTLESILLLAPRPCRGGGRHVSLGIIG
ncbi:hypothetical protein [Streptomyces cyanogenus]